MTLYPSQTAQKKLEKCRTAVLSTITFTYPPNKIGHDGRAENPLSCLCYVLAAVPVCGPVSNES
jgi:hypothetical protein